MRKREQVLRERIGGIKKKLALLEDMRPGTLSRQLVGKRSVLYWQVSYTHKMNSRTEYVRPDQLDRIKNEIHAYRRFKKLNQQWVDTALQLSRLLSEWRKN
jgi:hypothetical protein